MVVGDFSKEVDVLVIGAGPGGYVAAIRAAQLGKSVVIVDKAELGGVCLNRGCIPSKALISAAHRYETMKESSEMGITASGVEVDFAKVQAWKRSVVQKLTGGVGGLMKSNKIEVVTGEAFFVSEDTVSVSTEEEGTRYKFNHCIIATGSTPIELKAFPYGGRILSSTEALELDHIPQSLLVIGGGYIGVELGQMLAKFGTKVTILEGSDSLLPGFEPELVRPVINNLKKLGVEMVTGAMASGAEETDQDVKVSYKVGEQEHTATAEYVLVTVGRKPNTSDMGLENIGVKLDERGLIEIDEQCRTSVPNIYAIGDIVKGPALAHKASYEGKVAAAAIAGESDVIDYKVIPAVVFSDPEIASVGYSESQAKQAGYEIKSGKFSFGANGRALSLDATEGYVKFIAEKKTEILIGAQVVGPEASTMIAELGLAIEMGATLEDVALTIHAHPTLGEMAMETAEVALGMPIHTAAPRK